MNKKSGQSNNNLWTAIIGVIGVIVSAALGYFDTQAIALCDVSASEDYHGKNPGRQYTFNGTVIFGNVIAYPYERP